MSNAIDINSESTRSRETLSFHWMAEFSNGILFQFEDNKENKFQEVINRFNDLEFFHLYHKDRTININFIVDLKKGLIKTLDSKEPEVKEEKKNIRLIYFRRNRVEIGEIDLKEKSHTIEYHLGFQYNDKLGNNRQVVLQIDESGNWILGE